jgi:nucleoside 2-deoxyribosyltransferase
VALPDLEGLENSDSVLALLDEVDTGTVFEVGYALAKGIKVIGYSQNPGISQLKMVRGSGIPVFSDYSTAIYHSIWAGCE